MKLQRTRDQWYPTITVSKPAGDTVFEGEIELGNKPELPHLADTASKIPRDRAWADL